MRWHYEIRDLASLPRVRGITHPPCMAGPWWLRWIRRAAAGRDCCWHHGVNWHLVSETAIGIALQAQASGTSPEDTFDALDLAACGLAGDDQTGLVLLLGPGAGIELDDEDPAGALTPSSVRPRVRSGYRIRVRPRPASCGSPGDDGREKEWL
jgi:hypothetical protein